MEIADIAELDAERDELMVGLAWLDERIAALERDRTANADEVGRLRLDVRARRRKLHKIELELDRLVGDLWVG